MNEHLHRLHLLLAQADQLRDLTPQDAEAIRWAITEVERLRVERDEARMKYLDLQRLVITSWNRGGDGKRVWRVNLGCSATVATHGEALAIVGKAIQEANERRSLKMGSRPE